MSVSSTTQKVVYTGDDVTSVFDYTFKIFADADLTVILYTIDDGTEETLTLTTDYTVTDAGEEAGGTVTLVAGALSSDYKLIIKRVLTLTQGVDLVENDPLPAETVEEALDRLTYIEQQQSEEIDRSLKIDSTLSTDVNLPAPEDGKCYKYDEGTDAFVNTTYDPDEQVVLAEAEADAAAVSASAASSSASASAASAVDSAASAVDSAASAVDAAASAASVNLPTLTGSDVGKVPVVNATYDGYDLSTINEFSTDGTLGGNSDTVVPTEKAVKTYHTANTFYKDPDALTVIIASVATVDVDATALNVGGYRLTSVNLTIDLTASGANGLDTGVEAVSTWYSVWVIYNPTTSTTAGLFSTSATAPTMPAGYTLKRLVGWARNDGSGNITIIDNVALAYNDRGDATASDFTQATMTTDGTYRDMDLSAIVPPGATAVALGVKITDDAVSSGIFRKNGNSNAINTFQVRDIVANVGQFFDGTVAVDSNRVIEYNFDNVTFTEIVVWVKGWWH